MFCSKCGSEISDKSIYCNKCGAKVNNNQITSIIDENIEESKIVSNSPKIKIKNVIIGLIILIGICASTFGGYEYVQAKNFDDLVKAANIKMNVGNYDEAIQLYDKALTYRNDSNVQKKLETAQNYKQFENVYNNGLKLMDDKKYSEAIQKFGTIKQSASKIYNNAQNKVSECKKNIINSDIEAANSAIKKEDYDSADKYVEDILKIDANDNDAKQLKGTITVAQEKAKNQQAEKLKQGAITPKEAIELVKNYLVNNGKYVSHSIIVDSEDSVQYVVHCYDVVETHNVTSGWYYVNKNTGNIQSMPLATGH